MPPSRTRHGHSGAMVGTSVNEDNAARFERAPYLLNGIDKDVWFTFLQPHDDLPTDTG